mgnify:CR=1 FL=1
MSSISTKKPGDTSMLDKPLSVRFERDERALLEKISKERKVNLADLIRYFVRQGLGEYDAKHEFLVSYLSEMKEEISKIRTLSSAAVGAISLLDSQRLEGEKLVNFKKYLTDSFKTSEAVKIGQDENLFNSTE